MRRKPRFSWSRAIPRAVRPSRRATAKPRRCCRCAGKILNVASASADKLRQNQELKDLIEALGCGVGDRFDRAKLRYGRVIIMTDADVDGAHIASLLMTFFYRELPELVRHGHIYLAQPPLYRLTQGAKSVYAMDDADREAKTKREFKAGAKVEVSRFKGLGEMPPAQLKETTMDPAKRTLLKVVASPEERATTNELVESLMGRRPELRFAFIQEHARTVEEVDVWCFPSWPDRSRHGQGHPDRGREGSCPPRPPNRACGFPAHGSPVAGFLIGSVSRVHGRLEG